MYNNLKTITLATGLALTLVSASTARASLIAYEGFDYAPETLLNALTGGYGWTTAWIGTGSGAGNVNNTRILSGSFTYNDGFGNVVTSIGNRVHVTGDGVVDGLTGGVANSGASPRRFLAYQGTSAGTTWVSFMAQRVGQPTTNAYSNANGPANYGRATGMQLFYNATPTSTSQGNENLSFGRGTANTDPTGLANDTWGLVYHGNGAWSKASTDSFITPANVNSTADFILVKITHNGVVANPMDDSLQMWVNPRLDNESLLGAATITLSPGDWGGTGEDRDLAFNAIRLFGGNWNTTVGNYSAIQVDEIKIGTEYLDVTLNAIPEPSVLALLGLGGLALFGLRRK